MVAVRGNSLYYLNATFVLGETCVVQTEDVVVWHKRLGACESEGNEATSEGWFDSLL